MNKQLFFALVIFLSPSVFAGPLGYKDGRWIFKAKESYFRTQNNYTNSGKEAPLPANGSLQTYTTALSLTHDLSDSFSAFGGLDLVYGRTIGTEFERTRFVPTDFRLGFDFRLLSGAFDVTPELQLTVPLSTVSETQDDAIMNEGATETRVGSYISKNFESISLYGYLGYAHRGDGRSALLPYELQSIFSLWSTQTTFGIWGYQSLTDDSYVNTADRRGSITARVNGGSLRFYSVNPNLMEAGFSFGFPAGESWFARIGASTTLLGSRTASGQTLWLSLSHSFGVSTPRTQYREQKKVEEKVQEQKKKEFIPETYEIPEDENPYDDAVKDLPGDVPQKRFKEPGDADIGEATGGTKGPAPQIKLRSANKPRAKKTNKKSRK